jgi:hypothetical protein
VFKKRDNMYGNINRDIDKEANNRPLSVYETVEVSSFSDKFYPILGRREDEKAK